jgi:AcrR family transcriptional regulator
MGPSPDPRVVRTRQLLQTALEKLLKKKAFEQISVQDITEAATLNRATFYDHYSDKTALLECIVASRFMALLDKRGIRFAGGCPSALKAIVLAVCDYLSGMRHLEPHMESAIVAVLRKVVLDGLQEHPATNGIPAEMRAAIASGAIYGAAKEWAQAKRRCSAEQNADTVMTLLLPVLQ